MVAVGLEPLTVLRMAVTVLILFLPLLLLRVVATVLRLLEPVRADLVVPEVEVSIMVSVGLELLTKVLTVGLRRPLHRLAGVAVEPQRQEILTVKGMVVMVLLRQ